jgi:MYXO-CTERM domain-containing protein
MPAPRHVARRYLRPVPPLLLGLTWAVGGACGMGGVEAPVTEQSAASVTPSNKVDVLFMVDNSSSMTAMQQKMLQQFPVFVQTLSTLPGGLPDLHLAVISSDLGAPSDVSIGCTNTGNGGNFFALPEGTCTATGLQPGAMFITDDGTGATKNFSGADPTALSNVFQCIALLGANGCGFEHQLASVARALGADGSPAPTGNAGFLRPDAELAIVMLTNEDDCSAPASSAPLPIYSLNGAVGDNLETPGGPLGNYRCNGAPYGGHLCKDPTGTDPNALAQPPLKAPADATGNPLSLTLSDCESDDSGSSELTTVGSLIAGIKALKGPTGPDIVVGAIMAPSTPYTVAWQLDSASSELFPNVEHSCSAADGSFGDPPVRIAQFVQAFGDNGVTQSICDSSYAPAFSLIASKIASHLPGAPSPGSDGGVGGFGGFGGFGGGSVGAAGTNGHAGSNGQGGTQGTGTGATTGSAGSNGTGGATGSAGSNGTGGATGSAGSNGSGATTGSAGSNGTGATTGSAGGNGTGATTGSAGSNGTGASGGGGTKGTGGSTVTGTGGSSASGAAGSVGAADGGQDGLGKGSGCDCGVGGSPRGGWGFLPLLGLLFVRRRRRRG